ncbi:uncharacterized protein LOC142339321 isoform X2 [Convolutriloba macropyga]|uniref:uncharacterized protein LOC142339321 isoform X2 n=1 Tax=Convolutriloba macropyga TaxID=536237 RepID=UPI003F525940
MAPNVNKQTNFLPQNHQMRVMKECMIEWWRPEVLSTHMNCCGLSSGCTLVECGNTDKICYLEDAGLNSNHAIHGSGYLSKIDHPSCRLCSADRDQPGLLTRPTVRLRWLLSHVYCC